MSCVLRAGGKRFDVDVFLKGTKLSPCAVFRKGELIGTDPKGEKRNMSGLNIDVGSASFDDFKRQIKDAINFLHDNKAEIKKLVKAKGLDEPPELDFAIRKRDSFAQSDLFPAKLVALAGSMGLSIRLSQYPIEDENPPNKSLQRTAIKRPPLGSIR